MYFPGPRNAKHYFPVSGSTPPTETGDPDISHRWYLLGLDQILVDLEVHAPPSFTDKLGLVPGESMQLSDEGYAELINELEAQGIPHRYAAGGTVSNTLNNYALLSNEPALLLGTMPAIIRPADAAFHYVAQTHRLVDMNHVKAVEGMVGTAVTFVFPDGDRSFAVAGGVSNAYDPNDIPVDRVENATAVLASLYTLINPEWPIAKATHHIMKLANQAKVPVAFGLGTASLVSRLREEVIALLKEHVTIASMNAKEAEALTGLSDPLLACQKALDWVDIAIVTQGSEGLTIGGFVDESYQRPTRQEIKSATIEEYNRYEYSRLMRYNDCAKPKRIFTQIPPYHGGPNRIRNCSGAGDAALAAALHDIAANRYHRTAVPDSYKHRAPFLSYSSLSRIAQYGNRVAYEVLKGSSPRLDSPVGRDKPVSSEKEIDDVPKDAEPNRESEPTASR